MDQNDEKKIKHLEMIEKIIERMASNSFRGCNHYKLERNPQISFLFV